MGIGCNAMNEPVLGCPICDSERVKLWGEYERALLKLRVELNESLAVLVGAHARGEHDEKEDDEQ